jgi:hypothetical protein
MVESPPNETIIRRIQKLLSLATGDNNSEEEAAAAMAMAQKMLAAYNLDFHTVQAAQVAGGASVIEEKREKTLVDTSSAMYKWQRELWKAVAESNFCWHWVTQVWMTNPRNKKRVYVKRHMLLGSESNVLGVRLMAEYLIATIARLNPYNTQRERMSRSAMSWRAGCADRLAERIREQAAQSVKKSTAPADSTALTLRNVADREYAANYDARYGKGAWADKQKDDAEWEAGAEQRRKEQIEKQAKAQQEWIAYLLKESPQQKKQREREEEKERLKEERANLRYRRSYWNERARESSKIDRSAYEAGSKAGSNINISRQAGAGKAQEELPG